MDIQACSEPAEAGLRCYVQRVAAGLGLGEESAYCELAELATAYIALPGMLGAYPDREVALVWDDTYGWAVGVEASCGEDLLMARWYGADLLPIPEDVVAFTKAVLAGEDAGRDAPPEPPAGSPADLHPPLATYLTTDRLSPEC